MNLQETKKILYVPGMRLYCVLDGVLVPDLPTRLAADRVPHYCIVTGDLDPDMVHAAPYLVYLAPESNFAEWVFSEAFGKGWGIFFHSHRSLLEMRRHFRALHEVLDERGNPLRFRYYDPSVMRRFLPTCNGGELKIFFGDVAQFFVESETGNGIISYRIANGELASLEVLKEDKANA
ncbi:MAG TPA: DUF4123 domain-containing protein [Pyrinomonadaceae bacterium]|nr:DUF4123 domain-containing protein [Pyrinomonadaceae bacterium]